MWGGRLCYCRPAVLSSQSWPLQAQPQLLTAAQPTAVSCVSVQLSRSQESLMQSTVPRPLTFSQQIRPQQPQQLAVLTQKPVPSSVTRHGGQYILLLLFTDAAWWGSACIHDWLWLSQALNWFIYTIALGSVVKISFSELNNDIRNINNVSFGCTGMHYTRVNNVCYVCVCVHMCISSFTYLQCIVVAGWVWKVSACKTFDHVWWKFG